MKSAYKIKINDNTRWVFDGDIAKGFDKHISSSIPIYEQTNWLALEYSDFFIKKNSNVYDLGSSTGSFLKTLQQRHRHYKKIRFIGIDTVSEMIKHSNKMNKSRQIKYLKKNIIKLQFLKSDLVFCIYTMQFIERKHRLNIIKKIYNSLNSGGAFIFAEKIRSINPQLQDMTKEIYMEWKIDQGFTAKEVLLKTKSLKGVLDTNSSQNNLKLLKLAGFKHSEVISQFLNFQTILAVKE